MKHIGGVFAFLCLLLAITTRASAEWWIGTDEDPRPLGNGGYAFTIRVPIGAVGLQFVGSQYDFVDFTVPGDYGEAQSTHGIAVDYAYDGRGIDFTDTRTFLAIAPTLFDLIDGFIHGWALVDLRDGYFRGTVYATRPLVRVYFTIAADQLIWRRGWTR